MQGQSQPSRPAPRKVRQPMHAHRPLLTKLKRTPAFWFSAETPSPRQRTYPLDQRRTSSKTDLPARRPSIGMVVTMIRQFARPTDDGAAVMWFDPHRQAAAHDAVRRYHGTSRQPAARFSRGQSDLLDCNREGAQVRHLYRQTRRRGASDSDRLGGMDPEANGSISSCLPSVPHAQPSAKHSYA